MGKGIIMRRKIIVKDNNNIISILNEYGIGKNKVKSLVHYNNIYVNGNVIMKLPFNVKIGDIIEIKDEIKVDTNLDIVYEDSNYLIINKEAGLLTISTSNQNKDKEITLYKKVRDYLNKKKEYSFIVNRIDKETSGIVVFVKNLKLKEALQSNWNDIVKKRGYIAIVSGKINNDGRIDNYLYEDKKTFVHSSSFGKRSITNYKVIKSNSKYTMLDINIETGRKNQIRVHMTEMGHPIVGDKKYYSKDNSLKRLCLHAYELDFIDPISKKKLVFKSEVPKSFYSLF